MFRWYVVNTYSGHEQKVKHNLEHRIVSLGQQRAVRQIVVPTETVSEMKDNQKVMVEKRTMPGYVLVNMDLNEDSWSLVKGTPGVTGFVGASNEPVPLTQDEVNRLLHREAEVRPRSRAQFGIGESVKVVSGTAVGLLRRDLRGQRRRSAAQGARLDLRARDAGRGRLRPGEEGMRKVLTQIKLQAVGGQASPAPPVGPALGQHGVNIMEFVKAFNAQTQGDAGTVIPVVITVYEDRSFTFVTKSPPAAVLDKAGAVPGEGLRRAASREGRHDHPGSTAADRREEDEGPQRPGHGLCGQDHRGDGALDGRGCLVRPRRS